MCDLLRWGRIEGVVVWKFGHLKKGVFSNDRIDRLLNKINAALLIKMAFSDSQAEKKERATSVVVTCRL